MKLKVGDLVRTSSGVDIGLGLIINYDPYEYYEPYTVQWTHGPYGQNVWTHTRSALVPVCQLESS
jgi:hypothetical protein